MFETDSDTNSIISFTGVLGQILNNVPEQGIELEAFLTNTGFKDNNGNRPVLEQNVYINSVEFNIGQKHVTVYVTPGANDTWYVYPSNLFVMMLTGL